MITREDVRLLLCDVPANPIVDEIQDAFDGLFTEIERLNTKPNNEQRRYEIAREILAVLWSFEHITDSKKAVEEAIYMADLLLAELNK